MLRTRKMACGSVVSMMITIVLLSLSEVMANELFILTDIGQVNAIALNNHGVVVGQSDNCAFLWQDGIMSQLWCDGVANGINDNGEIVGTQSGHAVRYQTGIEFLEEPAQSEDSRAADINEQGRIAGSAGSGVNAVAVVWQDGKLLGTIFQGWAKAINNNGQVCGGLGGNSPVYLWDNGFATVIPGAGEAFDMNDSGEVVGRTLQIGGEWHAFITDQGEAVALPDLGGGNQSRAHGINATGVVVGISKRLSATGYSAVMWKSGQVINLSNVIFQNPGWELSFATAINDQGQILAAGASPTGVGRAVLLTPIRATDLNGDQHTDLLDFAIFQNDLTGP